MTVIDQVENWAELSPEKKRAERFRRWLEPPGVEFASPAAARAYRERATRFVKTIGLEEPDRVPVMLPSGFLPAYLAGGTLQSVMYDYDALRRAWFQYIDDFEMDTFDGPGLVFPARALEGIDYRLFKWPGHGLSPDTPSYQYVEGEYMTAGEYDDLISNPADFLLRAFLPRAAGALEALRHLDAITPHIAIPIPFLGSLGREDVQAAFAALLESGREVARWQKVVIACGRRAREAGIPSLRGGGITHAPFDVLGDMLRGTQGVMMDMYRRPEKLMEAMERMVPILIDVAVEAANTSGRPFIFIPLHKGDDTFMSAKQYETFYWPPFRKVLMGLIDEGVVPLSFAEGKYETRLDIIRDLPAGAAIWWFDQTDMARAKKALGGNACIAGNVPASLLCTGAPAAVKDYCRRLIEDVAHGGGLILAGAAGMDRGDPENLRAMMAAAREYGAYR